MNTFEVYYRDPTSTDPLELKMERCESKSGYQAMMDLIGKRGVDKCHTIRCVEIITKETALESSEKYWSVGNDLMVVLNDIEKIVAMITDASKKGHKAIRMNCDVNPNYFYYDIGERISNLNDPFEVNKIKAMQRRCDMYLEKIKSMGYELEFYNDTRISLGKGFHIKW